MKTPPTFRGNLLLLLILSLLLAPLSAFAQDQKGKKNNQRKQPDYASMTEEERRAAIEKRIEQIVTRYEKEMGDKAPTAEQRDEFVKLIASNFFQSAKLRSEMMKARRENKGGGREAMMAMASKREKIDSELVKGMKELLEKPQFKAFKKAKEKIQPQRRPGGGRGPGGGGRGPGGGGGRGPQ